MTRASIAAALLLSSAAFAQIPDADALKKAAQQQGKAAAGAAEEKSRGALNKAGAGALEKKINEKLLEDARQNQCSFKSGSDELEPGCDKKSKKLADVIIDVKKTLQGQGQTGFKFIVSGHTDSSGDAAKNKELSARRAQVMVKQLVAKGVSQDDIEAVGMGSERMLVKPDDTAAKKAKNRRYEVEVKF